jgi:hypothetical protein
LRNALSFLFVPVVWGADCQPSLRSKDPARWGEPPRLNEVRDLPIADDALQLENGVKLALVQGCRARLSGGGPLRGLFRRFGRAVVRHLRPLNCPKYTRSSRAFFQISLHEDGKPLKLKCGYNSFRLGSDAGNARSIRILVLLRDRLKTCYVSEVATALLEGFVPSAKRERARWPEPVVQVATAEIRRVFVGFLR